MGSGNHQDCYQRTTTQGTHDHLATTSPPHQRPPTHLFVAVAAVHAGVVDMTDFVHLAFQHFHVVLPQSGGLCMCACVCTCVCCPGMFVCLVGVFNACRACRPCSRHVRPTSPATTASQPPPPPPPRITTYPTTNNDSTLQALYARTSRAMTAATTTMKTTRTTHTRHDVAAKQMTLRLKLLLSLPTNTHNGRRIRVVGISASVRIVGPEHD